MCFFVSYVFINVYVALWCFNTNYNYKYSLKNHSIDRLFRIWYFEYSEYAAVCTLETHLIKPHFPSQLIKLIFFPRNTNKMNSYAIRFTSFDVIEVIRLNQNGFA